MRADFKARHEGIPVKLQALHQAWLLRPSRLHLWAIYVDQILKQQKSGLCWKTCWKWEIRIQCNSPFRHLTKTHSIWWRPLWGTIYRRFSIPYLKFQNSQSSENPLFSKLIWPQNLTWNKALNSLCLICLVWVFPCVAVGRVVKFD